MRCWGHFWATWGHVGAMRSFCASLKPSENPPGGGVKHARPSLAPNWPRKVLFDPQDGLQLRPKVAQEGHKGTTRGRTSNEGQKTHNLHGASVRARFWTSPGALGGPISGQFGPGWAPHRLNFRNKKALHKLRKMRGLGELNVRKKGR